MLELKGITKRFPGVVALEDVSFDLRPGEIHVLFGENGAGKSTLVNVMVGNLQPNAGSYCIDGKNMSVPDPAAARAHGVSAVFQEFSLAPSLSVVDNIWLGRELKRFGRLDRARMKKLAEDKLADMRTSLPLNAVAAGLTRAQKQQAEIAKALLQNTRYIIFDEPTASLTDVEANNVLRIIKELRASGVGIVYISHRMREIRALADRVSVLRNGRHVATLAKEEIEEERLVSLMMGRSMIELFPQIPHKPVREVLSIDSLATASGGVKDVCLSVHAGEVVGLAGLVGCGKGRIGRACFGIEAIIAGEIRLNNKPVRPASPADMLKQGICYFPSDRAAEGLCLNRSIAENVTMSDLNTPELTPGGILDLGQEQERAHRASHQLKLSTQDITTQVELLSGGNKQKTLLARGLSRNFDIFIFDEPTVGVDIGAKAEIYRLMHDLTIGGAAVLVISSDLEEVVHISHRIYAIHEGQVVAHLQGADKTEERVLASFFGRQAAPEPKEPESKEPESKEMAS